MRTCIGQRSRPGEGETFAEGNSDAVHDDRCEDEKVVDRNKNADPAVSRCWAMSGYERGLYGSLAEMGTSTVVWDELDSDLSVEDGSNAYEAHQACKLTIEEGLPIGPKNPAKTASRKVSNVGMKRDCLDQQRGIRQQDSVQVQLPRAVAV